MTLLAVAGVALVAAFVGILIGYYIAGRSFLDWLNRR